jgi:hypothetical protein
MNTSSREPFVVGRSYRVKKTVNNRDFSVSEGQVLRYLCLGYVPYDGLSYFNFVDEQGRRLYWGLYDDEPIDKWREMFEECDELA